MEKAKTTKKRGGVSKLRLSPEIIRILLIIFASISAVTALVLTFTVSDYYIFNRISQYGFFFSLSQWVKKAGLILIVLAVFFNCKGCATAVKYVLPVFVILSCCLYGDFFDIVPEVNSTNDEIFNSVNLFMPKWLTITLFFLHNVCLVVCCGLFVLQDGLKVKARAFINLPLAILAALPLNIFENFFDIKSIPQDSFLRFYNFTIWHFIALCGLVASTVGLYFFLRRRSRAEQDKWLCAIAVCLLLQYHSKDSMLLGDGYNVYRTVWAALPLFICNAGVYIASASVIFKKKFLYSASFFVHAIGALTVFIYFGKNEMSNYGIFCSYSILYFCLTHCLLFALCVLPSALGYYKFKIKDCIAPLIYYFIVIVVASLASGLVSDMSTKWTASDGSHLTYDDFVVTGLIEGGTGIGSPGYMRPNFAFTQVNPLPFEFPWPIKLGGFMSYINILYVLVVYIAYVCLFFAFYGASVAFLAVLNKIKSSRALRSSLRAVLPDQAVAEIAVAEEEGENAVDQTAADDEAVDQTAVVEGAAEEEPQN
ncbi:MAG: hypothetical protein ACI4QN_00620 [Candidatus Coproplasma sp.]